MFCYPIWFLIPYILLIIFFTAGLLTVFPKDSHIMHKIVFMLFYVTTVLVLSTLSCLVKHEIPVGLGSYLPYSDTAMPLPTSTL